MNESRDKAPYVPWLETDKGRRVQAAYDKWLRDKKVINPPPLRNAYLICEFFEEEMENLNLSHDDQRAADKIWEAAARRTENEPFLNLLDQAGL